MQLRQCAVCGTDSVACSKSEAPPPAATEAEQEPAVLPKVAADPSPVFPSVELVTAGERPRRVLRLDFDQGSKETLEVRTERKSTKGEVESASLQVVFNLPPVTFELAIETKEVSSDGTAQVGFEVVSLEVLGACCGYPQEVRKVLEESGFEGTTGKYAIDSQGFVTDVELASKSAGEEGAWQLLRGVFSQMSVPLSKEEVGEGGKWIVRRSLGRTNALSDSRPTRHNIYYRAIRRSPSSRWAKRATRGTVSRR